jgi:glycosyltransferase involved in cell wall biosynthesis
MRQRRVIFLNSNLPESEESGREIYTRWDSYGEVYASINPVGNNKIIVFNSFDSPVNTSHFPNLEFLNIKDRKFLNFLILRRTWQLINRNNETSYLIVSGISTFEMLMSSILKIRFGRRIHVQSQFHGNTYSFASNGGPEGFIRVTCANLLIALSDSVRVVSRFQKLEIESKRIYFRRPIYIAPIPINPEKISTLSRVKPEYIVSIVGRLHEERGTKEILEILERICEQSKLIRFEIVGSGFFQLDVQKMAEIYPGQISFHGYRDSAFLRSVYSRARILLSAAPSEGYGLALREAILSGVKVIARDSKGVRQLFKEFPTVVAAYHEIDEAVDLILTEFNSEFKHEILEDALSIQIQRDKNSLRDWISSWPIKS